MSIVTIAPRGVVFSNSDSNKGYLKVSDGVVVLGPAILSRLSILNSVSYDNAEFKTGKDGVTKFYNGTADLAVQATVEQKFALAKTYGIVLAV